MQIFILTYQFDFMTIFFIQIKYNSNKFNCWVIKRMNNMKYDILER